MLTTNASSRPIINTWLVLPLVPWMTSRFDAQKTLSVRALSATSAPLREWQRGVSRAVLLHEVVVEEKGEDAEMEVLLARREERRY
jgi:hypothetical protein